jgi:hypothetical protein
MTIIGGELDTIKSGITKIMLKGFAGYTTEPDFVNPALFNMFCKTKFLRPFPNMSTLKLKAFSHERGVNHNIMRMGVDTIFFVLVAEILQIIGDIIAAACTACSGDINKKTGICHQVLPLFITLSNL